MKLLRELNEAANLAPSRALLHISGVNNNNSNTGTGWITPIINGKVDDDKEIDVVFEFSTYSGRAETLEEPAEDPVTTIDDITIVGTGESVSVDSIANIEDAIIELDDWLSNKKNY